MAVRKCNVNCCVPQCSSSRTKNPELSFHIFPINERRKRQWILALRIGNINVSRHQTVCSKHFVKFNYFPGRQIKVKRLKLNAIPSQYLPKSLSKTVSVEGWKKNFQQKKNCIKNTTIRPLVICVKADTSVEPPDRSEDLSNTEENVDLLPLSKMPGKSTEEDRTLGGAPTICNQNHSFFSKKLKLATHNSKNSFKPKTKQKKRQYVDATHVLSEMMPIKKKVKDITNTMTDNQNIGITSKQGKKALDCRKMKW